MERFIQRLSSCSVIGLDTSLFIYHFEANPLYSPLTHYVLSLIETGKLHGITSTITLMEIIVRPLSLDRQDIAQKYEALLVNFPNLTLVDLDRAVIRQAAILRAAYRLRPPDALQISASLVHRADAFLTNDRLLARLQDRLPVILLDDFT